jgi:hypothetical protein
VIWLIILLLIGRIFTNALTGYKVIGIAVTIIMFCVLGFFALTRYSSVFTYSLKNDRLRVNRKIGHRNKEVEMPLSAVRVISRQKPSWSVKRTYNMRATVFSSKLVWYVVYEKDGSFYMLVFEPTKKMADKIKSRAKASKNNKKQKEKQ